LSLAKMGNQRPILNSIVQGDCLQELKQFQENSVDAIVADPPYGLSFMGKDWDSFKAVRQTKNQIVKGLGAGMRMTTRKENYNFQLWATDWAIECLRVLKPGGYMLAFGGTRMCHRLITGMEDAGFEIRDMIAWVYGQGFPKSLDISKAIDKQAGIWRGKAGAILSDNNSMTAPNYERTDKGEPLTSEAKQWGGWGTALKPALEPITVARKPLSEKSVALNVLKWGTGGINIDACRVGTEEISVHNAPKGTFAGGEQDRGSDTESYREHTGRFPANLIHDGSDEVAGLFPESKGMATQKSSPLNVYTGNALYHSKTVFPEVRKGFNDNGSAARFFYCAKASKAERNMGCEGLEEKLLARSGGAQGAEANGEDEYLQEHIGLNRITKMKNNHPTVKPLALMEYLVKLVSREGAIVLDPFAGSGSTLIACKKLGRKYIGIEKEKEYVKIAKARIEAVREDKQQTLELTQEG
jgi:site-specific DNA-methyltransferase (adenine-specific)